MRVETSRNANYRHHPYVSGANIHNRNLLEPPLRSSAAANFAGGTNKGLLFDCNAASAVAVLNSINNNNSSSSNNQNSIGNSNSSIGGIEASGALLNPGEMVLQSFENFAYSAATNNGAMTGGGGGGGTTIGGIVGGGNIINDLILTPYADFAPHPSNGYYTDIDANFYSQGKFM